VTILEDVPADASGSETAEASSDRIDESDINAADAPSGEFEGDSELSSCDKAGDPSRPPPPARAEPRRPEGAISMNHETDAEDDDTRSRRGQRFASEFSFGLTCAVLVVGVIALLGYPLSETMLVTCGLYSVVAWIAGHQASHIHFLRIGRADLHPFLVILMVISQWLCLLYLIWYVYEAGFKSAVVLVCISLALRLPLIALERLVLQGSEWRITVGGIVVAPVLLACLVLLNLPGDRGQSETHASACKSGAASCEPWERDWHEGDIKPGSVVTEQGQMFKPKR
jgi:hypothetical protein